MTSGAIGLNYGQSLYLRPYFVYAGSKASASPELSLLNIDISIYLCYLKEIADQEVNVSEKTGVCTQTILVQT